MMIVTRGLIAVALTLGLAPAAVAQLDPNLTPPEFKCETAVAKADAKYFKALAKCELKCQKAFAAGLEPATDCYAPYAGAMATCVGDPVNGASAKVRAAVAKACDPLTSANADCPECYDAAAGSAGCGDPGYANDQQQLHLEFFDVFPPSTHCRTAGATPAQRKCQDTTLKVVAKEIGGIYQCFGKCFARAHEGAVPGADCMPNPVLPNDATTQTCLGLVETKSIAAYDHQCAGAGVSIQCPFGCDVNVQCDSAPMAGDGICTDHNCTAGNTSTLPYATSSYWTTLVENATAGMMVDSGLGPDTGTYCSQ